MDEVVYAIWDFAWGEHWFLYELGETDDGFCCRCVEADSWETLALGLGDSATEAMAQALSTPSKKQGWEEKVSFQKSTIQARVRSDGLRLLETINDTQAH